MNSIARKAIKASIIKWQKIALGTGKDRGWQNCPLCLKFYDHEQESCGECPVAQHTGEPMCFDTPYEDEWYPELRNAGTREDRFEGGAKASTPALRRAAFSELLFLESLLK